MVSTYHQSLTGGSWLVLLAGLCVETNSQGTTIPDNSSIFQTDFAWFCHSGSLSVCNEARLIIPISFLNPQLKCHDFSLVSYGFPRNASCAETAKCALAAASAKLDPDLGAMEPWRPGRAIPGLRMVAGSGWVRCQISPRPSVWSISTKNKITKYAETERLIEVYWQRFLLFIALVLICERHEFWASYLSFLV